MTPAESHTVSESLEWEQVVVCRWPGACRSSMLISGLVILFDYGFTTAIVHFPCRHLSLPSAQSRLYSMVLKMEAPDARGGGSRQDYWAPCVSETVFWTVNSTYFTKARLWCPASMFLGVCRDVREGTDPETELER